MNRYAIYARFSSENQKDSSIDDQIRNCENYAEKQGWIIPCKHIYSDMALSGSISNGRPGYQSLLQAVERKEIDAILVDSLDRFSRDQEELFRVYKRLKFSGVTLIGVTDGYNGKDKLAKVNLTVKGLLSEMFLDDLKDKTRRGLEGVFLNGRSPGGAPYGYRSVPIEDAAKVDSYGRPVVIGARKEIDPEKAETVLKIFRMSAQGHSSKEIAHKLNELGIPSPRGGSWSFSTICGDPKKALGILNNPIYIGKPIWNRTEWMKNPTTEKRAYKKRAEAEWIHVDIPELQIVPEDLWNAVKEKQRDKARMGPFYKQKTPKYLLSGLVKCGTCGCNFILQYTDRYQCSGRLNRGEAVCQDRESLFRNELEANVLDALKTELIEDLSTEITRRIEVLLREKTIESNGRIPQLHKSLKKAVTEKENILKAIKLGVITPGIKEELLEIENRINQLKDEMGSTSSRQDTKSFESLPAIVGHHLSNLEKVWGQDSARAGDLLRKVVDRIAVENGQGGTFLRISGTWERLVPMNIKPNVVSDSRHR